jgi:uncharacterized protein YqkB
MGSVTERHFLRQTTAAKRKRFFRFKFVSFCVDELDVSCDTERSVVVDFNLHFGHAASSFICVVVFVSIVTYVLFKRKRAVIMNITFTEKAMQQLEPILGTKRLKLKYDADGCGCAVNGVPTLWLVARADEDDIEVATNYAPILLEKHELVFYDEMMTIDVVEGAGCFQLKSPNQILNPRMSLVEVSEQHE